MKKILMLTAAMCMTLFTTASFATSKMCTVNITLNKAWKGETYTMWVYSVDKVYSGPTKWVTSGDKYSIQIPCTTKRLAVQITSTKPSLAMTVTPKGWTYATVCPTKWKTTNNLTLGSRHTDKTTDFVYDPTVPVPACK